MLTTLTRLRVLKFLAVRIVSGVKIGFPPQWPGFAADCVRVASMRNILTTHWLFASGQRGGATGFYGDVSLVVRKPDPDSVG